MGRIRQLSEQLSGWIAAGEVVERPASVVKELIENSVDAGASAISISITGGGIRKISVADNGEGVAAEDMPLTVVKHATSKIYSVDDLRGVTTMGFRGEALSSIAAVSMLTLRSRRRGAESGTELSAAGGKIEYIREAGLPEGTLVLVENLFYNTPARLKFLKKPGTETAAISELVSRLILAYPEISVKYTSNEQTIYHSPGSGSLADAIICVFGREARPLLREVDHEISGIRVHGWCGLPVFAQKSPRNQCIYVNRRYVKSDALTKAVRRAYTERILHGSYPFCVLHIDMPFSQVDPNVHPNKLTVHFADEEKLSYIVTEAVEEAIARADTAAPLRRQPTEQQDIAEPPPAQPEKPAEPPPAAQTEKPAEPALTAQAEKPAEPTAAAQTEKPVRSPFASLEPDEKLNGLESAGFCARQYPNFRSGPVSFELPRREPEPAPEPPPMLTGDEGIRLIGTAFETYIIVQNEDTLYLIDQHAAHERLVYDRLTAEKPAVSPLLCPELITLSPEQMRLICDNLERIEQMGVELEPFGPTECRVTAIPVILGETNVRRLIEDMLEALSSGDARLRRDRLAKAACKRAVRAGEALSAAEAREIVRQIAVGGAIPHCPHGRPIAVAIRKTELEKSFKRKV